GRVARQLGQLEPGSEALLARSAQVVGQVLEPLALGSVAGDELTAALVLVDRTFLSHSVLQARRAQVRNGKLKPRSSARASSSEPAVVHTITSMPRISSTLS